MFKCFNNSNYSSILFHYSLSYVKFCLEDRDFSVEKKTTETQMLKDNMK